MAEHFERRGIQELREALAVCSPLGILDREQPIVQPHFHGHRMRGRDPVERRLDLAAIPRVAAARGRIVGAPELDDRPGGVLDHVGAGDEVGAAQPDFLARRQAEELLRRILLEVVLLDVEHAGERHLACARRRILGVVDHVDLFGVALGIVRDDDSERAEHRHHAGRAAIEILAHRVLELRHVDHILFFGDADTRAEIPEGLRRVAPPTQPANRRHPRVVPSRHVPLLHELQQLPFAHHGVVQVEPRELDLVRPIGPALSEQVLEQPVVQGSMVLELERAQRVRNLLEGIRQRVREVVHRIDAPRVPRAVMRGVADPVERRVPHVEIRRRHVDLRPQHVRAVRVLPRPHAGK